MRSLPTCLRVESLLICNWRHICKKWWFKQETAKIWDSPKILQCRWIQKCDKTQGCALECVEHGGQQFMSLANYLSLGGEKCAMLTVSLQQNCWSSTCSVWLWSSMTDEPFCWGSTWRWNRCLTVNSITDSSCSQLINMSSSSNYAVARYSDASLL
jgi:hypothetical protein